MSNSFRGKQPAPEGYVYHSWGEKKYLKHVLASITTLRRYDTRRPVALFCTENHRTILEKNLTGTGLTFHPDPYPDQQLFYRSDNATLARLGVPAHTISTAKMDSEPHYHKASDHVETLDLENMALIIKSIALSSTSIVAGKETPTRVKKEDLQ